MYGPGAVSKVGHRGNRRSRVESGNHPAPATRDWTMRCNKADKEGESQLRSVDRSIVYHSHHQDSTDRARLNKGVLVLHLPNT
jgi:hypothetical protein